MNILGIETSCDETAAAVVRDGLEVLSNVVYTQIPLHQPYGGVVPELASRAHVEKISPVVKAALDAFAAAAPGEKIDAVAVTYGPGLSPALIVGLNAAKGLALSLDVPLIGVNHIEAHLHTPFLVDAPVGRVVPNAPQDGGLGTSRPTNASQSAMVGRVAPNAPQNGGLGASRPTNAPQSAMVGRVAPNAPQSAEVGRTTFTGSAGILPASPSDQISNLKSKLSNGPFLGLAISGGHTNWFDIPEYGVYRTIGQTLDDAAGEAFDKAAKLLGLGYPGGPKVDKIATAWFAAQSKNPPLISFPKGRPREGVSALAGLPADLCVSFSGLKTALLRHVQQNPALLAPPPGSPRIEYAPGADVDAEVARVVASYQEAIVGAVIDRTRTALRRRRYKSLIVGGGVSLNSRLRAALSDLADRAGVELLLAKPKYCGDNAAMIAGLAYFRRAVEGEDALNLDVAPSLETGTED